MAAETLRLNNFPEANLVEITKFSADAAAAAATFTVDNADNIAADAFLVLGRRGFETAEIKRVSSVASQTITPTATLTFARKKYDEVVKLRGDKVRVYRAANVDGTAPVDGSFSLIETVAIQPDQNYTEYTASTGGSGYWWKQTFYHSVSLVETELSASVAVRGGDSGHYASIEEIRTESGFTNNSDVTDQMISDRRDDAESQVNGVLASAKYTLPLTTPYPSVIVNCTKLLAAGYLLLQDYGAGADGTNKEGNAKIALAEKLLAKIKSKEIILVGQYTQTELSSTSIMRGWPDSSTDTASETDAGGPKSFTKLKVL